MSIALDNLTKRYGAQTVVNRVSLEIAEGELFVLLGASGSGKSTILRLIAGLTPCDEGRVLIKGRDVTRLAPQPRGTGFVFQNYSIFRHMSVAGNIEFGLKIRKVPPAQRVKRCEELLELVGLTGLGERYADQISGGQQQRVALARALAYEPSVLLLDEPLGALDVKIRVQLRRSLKEIQRRLRVTTLLVTHDQEEAYELADRIGVMHKGSLLEVGEPEQLYARPKTLYVASFLGGGTILAGRAVEGNARFGPLVLPIPEDAPHEEGASVEVLCRPEEVGLSAEAPQPRVPVLGKGRIIEQTFSGGQRRLRLRLPYIPSTRQISPAAAFGEEGTLVDTVVPSDFPVQALEFWVSLRNWTILRQAPPHLLVVDTDSGSPAPLALAKAFAERMRASVTILSFGFENSAEELRTTANRRAKEAGLHEAEVHAGTGNFSQQIAAHCANALFEFIIMPPRLGATKPGLDRDVVSFLERTNIPTVVTAAAPSAISRILICTRAGEPGKSDIRIGGRLARHLGARATLLHVSHPERQDNPWVRRHLDRASRALTMLEVTNEVLSRANQSPAEGILHEAASHQLVVIGGHGPQSRSVFGRDDITLQVLSRAQCPVLVVPAEE